MAKGKFTGGRKFQPGKSGNMNGRPAIPDDLKGLKERFSKDLVERIFIKYMTTSVVELARIQKEDMTLPALDHIIIQVIVKAGLDGDQQRLNFLLDRTIGKVIDKSENTDIKLHINATLDRIPEDRLIGLLKESEQESFIEVETKE